MPFASAGTVITDSSQVNVGVINSGDIANGAILNEDINAAAAIDISKLAGVAAKGANADITSLSGLTTPLSVEQGGSGAASLDDHYVLIGSGVGAVTPITPNTAGYGLVSNGVAADPSFQVLPNDWVQVGQTILGGAANSITVNALPSRKHYKVLIDTNLITGVGAYGNITFNADGGANYSDRYSTNGAADTTHVNATYIRANDNISLRVVVILEITSLAGQVKQMFTHCSTGGVAATAPYRMEGAAIWDNIANAITSITYTNNNANNMSAGAKMTVFATKD